MKKYQQYILKLFIVLLAICSIELVSFAINYLLKIDRRGSGISSDFLSLSSPLPSMEERCRPSRFFFAELANCAIEARKNKSSWILTNNVGFAETPFLNFPSPDLKIAITGASPIFGVGVSSNQSTVPAQLEKIIFERMKIKVEIYNLAARNCYSYMEMLTLNEFLQHYDADIVLSISGRNETGLVHDIHSQPTSSLPIKRYVEFSNKYELDHSWIGKLISNIGTNSYSFNLLFYYLSKYKRNHRAKHQLENEKKLMLGIDGTVGQSLVNYSIMQKDSHNHGARYFMILQPTVFTKQTLSQEEILFANFQVEKIKSDKTIEADFYSKFKSSSKKFNFIDMTHVFDTVDYQTFVDDCHFNDRGASFLAEKIFEKISPTIANVINQKKRGSQFRNLPL